LEELIQHIENLLPEHDCIVVPGLGGFVQNEIPAHIDISNDSFYPASKGIGFNARLTFNDGLLAQAYQQTDNISFEEANLKIRQEVKDIIDCLNKGTFISLGHIGKMRKNEQGQIVFRSDNQNCFFPDSFGLMPFSYPPLKKRQENAFRTEQLIKKRKEDEFIHIRMHRNSIRNMFIGATVCLFLLLLSKPVGNLPKGFNQEAFMMHDYLFAVSSDSIKTDNQPTTSENDEIVLNKDENLITENQTKERIYQPEPKSKRCYYIVVSSFPQKESAQEWMRTQKHKSLFSSANIIEKDGRARVYIKKFRVKGIAETYLSQFRAKNAEYASAWLLSVKND
jgi:hypothetical protein